MAFMRSSAAIQSAEAPIQNVTTPSRWHLFYLPFLKGKMGTEGSNNQHKLTQLVRHRAGTEWGSLGSEHLCLAS